jgi:hypothetical protein
MNDETEYRIEYTIQRRLAGTDMDDFEDIGFGSSGGWLTIDHAAHMAASAIQNREWETEPGMPDPSEADVEVIP